MRLSSIVPVKAPDIAPSIREITPDRLKAPQSDSPVDFAESIKKAVGEVNSLQTKADDMAVKLATGDVEDVHKAMAAMQKARLALDFTIQVRNKVIEAYQEIMRMQV